MNMTADLKNGKAVTGLNAAVVTDWVFDLTIPSIQHDPACFRELR